MGTYITDPQNLNPHDLLLSLPSFTSLASLLPLLKHRGPRPQILDAPRTTVPHSMFGVHCSMFDVFRNPQSAIRNPPLAAVQTAYFILSKFFCKICQSFIPLTRSIAALLISASLTFFVALFTL